MRFSFPTQLWNPAGLLQTVPPLSWPWQWQYVGLLVFCVLLLAASFLPKLPALLALPIRKIVFNNLWIGLLLLFFRLERVPVFGMDIWRILQEGAMFILLALAVIHFRKTHPKLVLQQRVALYRNRFLPKPRP